MTRPRCPHCYAQGLKYLSIQKVSSFTLVYCGNCGAIHGIIPSSPQRPSKPTSEPSRTFPSSPATAPTTPPPGTEFDDLLATVGNADMPSEKPLIASQVQAKLNAMRMVGSGSRYLRVASYDGPPACPHHKTDMQEFIIPGGYKNAGLKLWVCPHYADCRQWEVAD